jgi:endonuclease YncB( thermonuclease family)
VCYPHRRVLSAAAAAITQDVSQIGGRAASWNTGLVTAASFGSALVLTISVWLGARGIVPEARASSQLVATLTGAARVIDGDTLEVLRRPRRLRMPIPAICIPRATGFSLRFSLVDSEALAVNATRQVQRERVRLFGVDAPESAQLCTDDKGDTYRCGKICFPLHPPGKHGPQLSSSWPRGVKRRIH